VMTNPPEADATTRLLELQRALYQALERGVADQHGRR
jgi:hypothetical protein